MGYLPFNADLVKSQIKPIAYANKLLTIKITMI